MVASRASATIESLSHHRDHFDKLNVAPQATALVVIMKME